MGIDKTLTLCYKLEGIIKIAIAIAIAIYITYYYFIVAASLLLTALERLASQR
jgi:hypothetical protein